MQWNQKVKCEDCGSAKFCKNQQCRVFCKICGDEYGKSKGLLHGDDRQGFSRAIACRCNHGQRLARRLDIMQLSESITEDEYLQKVKTKDGIKLLFVKKIGGEYVLGADPDLKLFL
jgi:hypothetical protein